MAETDQFAHGTYGDDSGVVFYGPPTNGFWQDRLAVSQRYADALLGALVARAWPRHGGRDVPKLAAEWNELRGWADAAGIQPLTVADARELIAAFGDLRAADIPRDAAGVTPEQCLRCAAAIAEFLRSRIGRGSRVYIEKD